MLFSDPVRPQEKLPTLVKKKQKKDRLVKTEGKKTKLIFLLRTNEAKGPIGRLKTLLDGWGWG